MGAGAAHPARPVAGQLAATHGVLTDATGSPAFDALFDSLLSDHEAEVEYQAHLAEVEAEFLNREQEEEEAAPFVAGAPFFAMLQRMTGEGVPF